MYGGVQKANTEKPKHSIVKSINENFRTVDIEQFRLDNQIFKILWNKHLRLLNGGSEMEYVPVETYSTNNDIHFGSVNTKTCRSVSFQS